MADAKVSIEVESKPVGFDVSQKSLKQLEKDVNATARAAESAQKRLGSGNEELQGRLNDGISALKAQQKNLQSLSERYNAAQKRIGGFEVAISKTYAQLEKLRNAGQEGSETYERLEYTLERLTNGQAQAEDTLDKLSNKMKEAAVSARQLQSGMNQLTQSAQRVIAAQREVKDTMGAATKATMGLSRANMALQQLMSGNVVGAFKSATSAVKLFWSAIVENPATIAIAAVAAAIGGLMKLYQKHKAEEEAAAAATKKRWEEARRSVEDASKSYERTKAEYEKGLNAPDFSRYTDAQLARMKADAQRREAQQNQIAERERGYASAGSPLYREATFRAADEARKAAHEKIAGIDSEFARRAAKARSDAEQENALRNELANAALERRMQEKYGAIENKDGKRAALEKQLEDLKYESNRVNNRLGSGAYGIEDVKKANELDAKILETQKQITAEIEKQAEAEKRRNEEAQRKADAEKIEQDRRAQAQEKWERSRQLQNMTDEERHKNLTAEINLLKTAPGNAENEERMRNAIDALDATKKSIGNTYGQAADLWNQKQDFLHRNDTDAQKLRDTSKYLEEAKASGDTSAMLELMMSGEELAGNYEEPLTKKQQRSAARKAKRDERAAKWAARAFRRQARAIEADWKENQGSAEEAAKKLTKEAGGTASFMVKNGRLVKVEGTEQTNRLLSEILKALE